MSLLVTKMSLRYSLIQNFIKNVIHKFFAKRSQQVLCVTTRNPLTFFTLPELAQNPLFWFLCPHINLVFVCFFKCLILHVIYNATVYPVCESARADGFITGAAGGADLDQPPGLGDDGHLHPVQGEAVDLSLQTDGHLANLQWDRSRV